MTTNVSIDVTREPDPADVQQIINGLVEFNTLQAGSEESQPLAAFVRDADGQIVGGIFGKRQWNWLFISNLWLHADLRGQGLGAELVKCIEALAVESGCDAVHLDTYSFQALAFYRHLGYQLFGELHDCPTGHMRHFLWKALIA